MEDITDENTQKRDGERVQELLEAVGMSLRLWVTHKAFTFCHKALSPDLESVALFNIHFDTITEQ